MSVPGKRFFFDDSFISALASFGGHLGGWLATNLKDGHASLALVGGIPLPGIFNDAVDEFIVEQHFEEFNLLVAQTLLCKGGKWRLVTMETIKGYEWADGMGRRDGGGKRTKTENNASFIV